MRNDAGRAERKKKKKEEWDENSQQVDAIQIWLTSCLQN